MSYVLASGTLLVLCLVFSVAGQHSDPLRELEGALLFFRFVANWASWIHRRGQPTIQYPKNTFQRPSAWQPCLRTSPLTHICIQSIYHQRQTRRAFQSPFVAKHFPSLSCASRTLHLLDWLATPFMPRASALTFSPCSCAIVLMDACSREA